MGGKTKQSQRTKNNVRPSSSGRSAELLTNISGDLSFLKLKTANGQPTLFPTITTIGLETGLNPDFQICIKKLNKKDPITKTKALQELSELVSSSKLEDVLGLLPIWTHFYKILTVDTERKVRECTQACHGAVLLVCGRRVAPHLKQILPAWLQAVHDDHAPAQTQALNSLRNTFPDKKLPEVLSFCKDEIMAYLIDSLIGNTDYLTRKIVSDEEKECHHQRLVMSSLRGLEYFTINLPNSHDDWMWIQLTTLLQNNVFWKFSSYKTEQIRMAWYALTGCLIERFKSKFSENYGSKTIKILLGASKESNSLIAANMWACLLQLMHSVEDWQKHLEKKELLSKRIFEMLENGGWGDARHLSNLLLPLLAHLPPEVFNKEFYYSFFEAIFTGLKKKNILSSKSERQTWITSLGECLSYLSIQEYEYVPELVTSVHRKWLQEMFDAPTDVNTRANIIKCSTSIMVSLLKYWLKQATEQHSETYETLIRNFWQNIGSTISTQIDKLSKDKEISKMVEHHVLLLKTLKISLSQDPKKQNSIKFETDLVEVTEKQEEVIEKCDSAISQRYQHNLEDLLQRICFKYFEFVNCHKISEPVMNSLLNLLIEFDDAKLFLSLANNFHLDTVYNLYNKVLREWMVSDTMWCKSLVDTVFLILRYLSEEEQNCTMESFQKLPSEQIECCVRAAVSHPYRDLLAVRRWMRSATVGNVLATLCTRFVNTGDVTTRNLLMVCLELDHRSEMLISDDTVSVIVQKVTEALSKADSSVLEQVSSFGAMLATTLTSEKVNKFCEKLLLKLFMLNCNVPRGDPRLSVDTWCEVRSSWQDGVSSLNDGQRITFLIDLAKIMQHLIFHDTQGVTDINNIENLTGLCPYLLSKDSHPPETLEIVSKFTENLLNVVVKTMEPYALHHDCVFSNLNCPFEDYEYLKIILEGPKKINKTQTEEYLNVLILRCFYMKMLLLHKGDDDGDEMWCDTLLGDELILMEFCKVMHDYSIVCSLCEGYTFWEHYQIINTCKEKLDTMLNEVANECSLSSKKAILKKLSELAASKGYYWSYARKYFEVMSKCDDDIQDTVDFSKLLQYVTGNGFFHTLQAKSKNSNDKESVLRTKFLVMIRSFYLAYGHQLETELLKELTSRDELTSIVNIYFRHNDTMLYEKDISDAKWREVVSNVAVLDYLDHLVQYSGWEMAAHSWDFTTITLCSLITSLNKSKQSMDSLKSGMISRSVVGLYVSVSRFISGVYDESTRRQPTEHVVHLPTEWRDIFAPDLHANLFTIIVHTLKSGDDRMNVNRAGLIEALMKCTEHMQWHHLPKPLQTSTFTLNELVNVCVSCFQRSTHLGYKYLAHATIRMITEPLLIDDMGKLTAWSDGEEVRPRPKLAVELFESGYQQLQEQALTSLAECDEADISLEEAHHECRMGWCAWLIMVDALHALIAATKDELRQQLVQVYRNLEYTGPLLSVALRLLPTPLLNYGLDNTTSPPVTYEKYFIEPPTFSLYDPWCGLCDRLSCRGVWWAVAVGGGGVTRAWSSAAGVQPARLLSNLVRTYITPRLVKDQFKHLQRHAHQLEDAEVTIRWSSNEISCMFEIEDRNIELGLWLAKDHPLGLPRVAGPAIAEAGINTNWIIVYLAHQSGTVFNALRMWMQAVNARVEKAPQCYVCYCRLEPGSGKFPKHYCSQCRNMFHNGCMNKWFSSSGKRTCPLCRKKL